MSLEGRLNKPASPKMIIQFITSNNNDHYKLADMKEEFNVGLLYVRPGYSQPVGRGLLVGLRGSSVGFRVFKDRYL